MPARPRSFPGPVTREMRARVDVVPTMLSLLEQPFDPERLDGRVTPEICETTQRRRPPTEAAGASGCDWPEREALSQIA